MIMLQGFSWESYKENEWGYTKWRNLQENVEEISDYFDSIWLPPSEYSGDGMGYWPYQLCNQNGEFGSKEELKTLIKSFKEKNVKVYADVIITHKKKIDDHWMPETFVNEYNFTEDDFCNSIVHDNGTICELYEQDSKKNNKMLSEYLDFIKYEMGYDGYRIDIAKALNGDKGKLLFYNRENVIHEYYDTNYNILKSYISDYPKEHQMFNFNMKYEIMNEGLAKGKIGNLVFNGKPGGLMDSDLRPQMINFVENHDTQDCFATYVDLHDRDKIILANAYMLMMNADCCIFWPHWVSCKDEIKQLIRIRKDHNIDLNTKVNAGYIGETYIQQNISSKGNILQLLIYLNGKRPDILNGKRVIYEGKYFAIIGEKLTEDNKTYPTGAYEIKNITLSVEKMWDNVYLWNDKLTWPGKKLNFKNGIWKKKYHKIPYLEFTLNNGDSKNPKQLPNIRICEDTIITKESIN